VGKFPGNRAAVVGELVVDAETGDCDGLERCDPDEQDVVPAKAAPTVAATISRSVLLRMVPSFVEELDFVVVESCANDSR